MGKNAQRLFKYGDFFYAHSFDRSFYHTVVYSLLIYTRLTICAENLLLLHPLIARLSTETAAFGFFVASVFVTPHAQREQGKVIGCGVHIYMFVDEKKV